MLPPGIANSKVLHELYGFPETATPFQVEVEHGYPTAILGRYNTIGGGSVCWKVPLPDDVSRAWLCDNKYLAIMREMFQPKSTFMGMDVATHGDDATAVSFLQPTKYTWKQVVGDFYIDEEELEKMNGKAMVVIDDVGTFTPAQHAKLTAWFEGRKKDYSTIGVRFLKGGNLATIYTYRIRKGAKVHLGQELVARTPTGDSVCVVVELHKTPQDTGPYNYKFIDLKVAPL